MENQKVNFCPLCFARPDEHGEGRERDTNVLLWADDIVALYDQLQALKSPEPEVATDAH